MNVGDLLVYSDNLVDVKILGIVIEVQHTWVAVATPEHGVRTYSKNVIESMGAVAK